MAGFIAGWTAGATIIKLVQFASNFTNEKPNKLDSQKPYRMKEESNNMKEELDRLQIRQDQIQGVLTRIENGPVTMDEMNAGLRSWIWQFKDAVDAADDLLDDFEYRRLQEQVHAEEGVKVPSISRPTTKFLKISKLSLGSDPLMERLTQVVRQLDRVVSNMAVFIQLVDDLKQRIVRDESHLQMVRSRETGSLPTETKIFGRDKEKEEITKWLFESDFTHQSESNTRVGSISVLTMVGIGGIGKTTLVQEIYNDAEVKRYFSKMMWVCVSSSFDVPLVLYKMVEDELEGSGTSRENNVDILQEALRKKLSSRRFLLVLDDVWDDEQTKKWKALVAPLQYGRSGSKILVTTRIGSVAKMAQNVMGEAIHKTYDLKSLEYDNFMPLFNRYAFYGVNIHDYIELQFLGKVIGKKLGGVPLLGKIVGGLLNSYLDYDYWERVLYNDVMELEEGDNKVYEILKLSYQNLPTKLRSCFRYCSIFPKDHDFDKDELVQMWMAVGLIPQPHTDIAKARPEDTGEEYFNALIAKSFLMETLWDTYRMHDCLHDLACNISKEECWSVKGIDSNNVPQSIRHLSVRVDDVSILKVITRPRNLRTLLLEFNGSSQGLASALNELVRELSNLRVLKLHGTSIDEFPIAINHLLHLRYISFYSTCNLTIPNSFNKLLHLQVIGLYLLAYSTTSDLETQCKELVAADIFNKLTSLRYFTLVGDHIDCSIALFPGFGKLTSLQKLDKFDVKDEHGYKLRELENLDQLHDSLDIACLENVKDHREANEASLKNKRFLNALSFTWSLDDMDLEERTIMDAKLVNHLEPHSELKDLTISGYAGLDPPYWLTKGSLSHLNSITIRSCQRMKQLPPLGNFLTLKSLHLVDLPNIIRIGPELYGVGAVNFFPVLEELKIRDLPECTEWLGFAGSLDWFPRLKSISISSCPQLQNIPQLPLCINEIDLDDVGISSLPSFWVQHTSHSESTSSKSSSSLSSLKLWGCANLTSLVDGLFENQEHLICLENLEIRGCQEVVSLPKGGFVGFRSLKGLYMELPPSMNICQNLFPASLERLTIVDQVEKCLPEIVGLTSLSWLELERSEIESLPSEEEFTKLTALEYLAIYEFKRLKSLGGLYALTFLKDLRIHGCDMLEMLEFERGEGIKGLTELMFLEIENCQNLVSMENLYNLTSLTMLTICKCPKLVCLTYMPPSHTNTENRQHAKALEDVKIKNCDELESLDFLMGFTAIHELSIFRCQNLSAVALQQSYTNTDITQSTSFSVKVVNIDDPSYLLLLPLRNFSTVEELTIQNCSQGLSLAEHFLLQNRAFLCELLLQEFGDVDSLPINLCDMFNLKTLCIEGAINLKSLPQMPESLKTLRIAFCGPELEEKCQRKVGLLWPKLAHIPSIDIIT
ncbi:hypothetical protein LUZ60_006807 [Juncus effusus]|nr:hypothetical protein LUZ60_006807 [Juncus effusus]